MLSVLLTRVADVTAVGNAGKQVEPSGPSPHRLGPFLFLAARMPEQSSAPSQLAWLKKRKGPSHRKVARPRNKTTFDWPTKSSPVAEPAVESVSESSALRTAQAAEHRNRPPCQRRAS
jgi:hypothetical protein